MYMAFTWQWFPVGRKAAPPAGPRARLVRRPTRFSPVDSFFPAWRPTRLPPPGGLTQLEGGPDAGTEQRTPLPPRQSRGALRQSSCPHHLPCPGPSRRCGQPPRPSSLSPKEVPSEGWTSSSLTPHPTTGPPQTPAWTLAACSAPAPCWRGPWSVPQRPAPTAPGRWAPSGVLGGKGGSQLKGQGPGSAPL